MSDKKKQAKTPTPKPEPNAALSEQKDIFIRNIKKIAADPELLAKIGEDLKSSKNTTMSKQEKKATSKMNQSKILDKAMSKGINYDILDIDESASIWKEITSIITKISPYITDEEIGEFATALSTINKANTGASTPLRLRVASDFRAALLMGLGKNSIRYGLIDGLENTQEKEAQSEKYKEYVDKRGTLEVGLPSVLGAINELYTVGMGERSGQPNLRYLYLAVQLASGLRKSEILNENSGQIDEWTDWQITQSPKAKNEIIIRGVAKKRSPTKVYIERPLIGLTYEQFMRALKIIRDSVTLDEKKSTKEQNKDLELIREYTGLNAILKGYFKSLFDQIEKMPEKHSFKDLSRQIYAGAANLLFNGGADTRTPFLKKLLAHNSSESTMSYNLVRVLPEDTKDKSESSTVAVVTEPLNDQKLQSLIAERIKQNKAQLRNSGAAVRDKPTIEGYAKKKEEFNKAADAIEKRGDKATVRAVMEEMDWNSTKKISEWLADRKKELLKR